MKPTSIERFDAVVGHPNAVLRATDGARVRAEFERCYHDGFAAAIALLRSPGAEMVSAMSFALYKAEGWARPDQTRVPRRLSKYFDKDSLAMLAALADFLEGSDGERP